MRRVFEAIAPVLLFATTSALVACTTTPMGGDAGLLDGASAVDVGGLDAVDEGESDASVALEAAARDVYVARRTLTPSRRTLADLAGFALSGRDIPRGRDAASVARRRYALAQVRAIGVHRVRTEFFWRDIEPRQGTFVWDDYDAFVHDAQEAGVDLLPVLAYGNTWASAAPTATTFYAPDDPQTFGRYATAVAMRYGDRLHDWEVWNEPNAGYRFWLPTTGGDPRAFGALVLEADRAVRAARPDARVAFGGTVFLPQFIPGGVEFVTRSLQATPALAPALRAFAMHTYTLYPPRVSPETDGMMEIAQTDKVARMAGTIASLGVSQEAPLWITEVGWPSAGAVTETLQARWLVRVVLLSALAGADLVFLYQLGDGPNAMNSLVPEQAFGVMRYDADPTDAVLPEPKPAHTALTTLFATVGAYRVVARETVADAPDDLHVLRLERDASSTEPASRALVAWRANDTAAPYPYRVPAAATAVRMLGERSEVAAGATVSVDGAPTVLLSR